MATYSAQEPTLLGYAPTYSAAAGGGDSFAVGPNTFLIIRNAGGSPITATVAVPFAAFNGDANAGTPVTVPATTGERWIRMDPRYAQASGLASVTYSAVTSVTVALVNVPA